MNQALRIIYAGTPEFAVPPLAALLDSEHDVVAVYTQPDRPAGRGRKLTASPVKQLAVEHGLPVLQPTSLKSAEAQAELAAFDADLMVVAAYGLILPQAVLDAPRLGCVNIHASLLPRWRGAAPIHRAVLAGDAETGITIMQMDAGLDTGAMLHKCAAEIGADETSSQLHDRLAALGAEALMQALPGIADGTLKGEAQDDALACYADKLVKSEGEIDWTQPAEKIARQVRGLNAWPVAETTLDGAKLRVWLAEAIDGSGAPGQVIAASRDGIDVGTGDGLLRITSLQLPGKRALSAADFVNSRDIVGAQLGGQ
jgi:methionyl-tRNA formyltransferase